MPTKVLIVDDSALIRKLLTEILDKGPGIQVVGSAQDPFQAREKIKALKPDVLTLDVEMPKMDGITFLANLMRLRPMPVVMISTLTKKGADVTLQALELGAFDFIAKPEVNIIGNLEHYAYDIRSKVKAAGRSRPRALTSSPIPDAPRKNTADAVVKPQAALRRVPHTNKLIAIGASTGGTEAIKEVLVKLPPDLPGMVITQHIPEAFSAPFARRLNNASALQVVEAADGQQILAGHAYVAPGNRHLLVESSGSRLVCRLHDGPPVNRHKPSVDVMFRSVAQTVGKNAIGVLLTGMGDDGARGLKEILDNRGHTIAQDEKSSVVWGMPGEAVKLGGAAQVLPLDKVAAALVKSTQSAS